MKTPAISSIHSCIIAILLLLLPAHLSLSATRGLQISVKDATGSVENVSLYRGSYALLVGVSNYNAGWPTLPSVPKEIGEVEKLLVAKGFHVEKILDPNGLQLESGFKDFINKFGLEKDNRLLFFFSGHGHTRSEGQKGYLVPIDAPKPEEDMTGFLTKALGMNQILSWARDIESKHALFLFDSCFSGTIFTQKSAISPPPHITRLTVEPVRQFITAGSAGEEVPAISSFTPIFIEALRHGLADLNNDGYVSATELGLYLQTELPAKAEQNPQYGKIRDYDLARGDFIFTAGEKYKKTHFNPPSPSLPTPVDGSILKVSSNPSGASVFIDNIFQGSTPILLNTIKPETYEIRAEKRGFLSETKFVEIQDKRHVSIDFELIALAAEGSLTINTVPQGVALSISEYQGAYTPAMKLPAGSYTIVANKHGFVTETTTIQISEGEDFHLNITLGRDLSVATPENREQVYSTNSTAKTMDSSTVSSQKIAPVLIESEKKKSTTQPEKSSLPADVQNYIRDLTSKNNGLKRNTAKIIYRKGIRHPAVIQTVEKELLKGASRQSSDRYHIDAMAWLCNVLGNTGERKYISTLTTVKQTGSHRKIKKYAEKNIRLLQK